MNPDANLVQHSDHQLRYPQGKKDDVQVVSFCDQCTRSIRYLHALSFSYLQGSEDHDELPEAKESRKGFNDQSTADDSGFEFASPASTPTRDNVLFCGRIIRQTPHIEQKHGNAKMGGLSANTKKFTYQRSVSNCSSSSARQSQKTLIGMLSFKAETGMSMSEMKKRQKQRERISLFPNSTSSGTEKLESAVAVGGDRRGDHREKTQVGLLRGMKPKGKLAGALAKALLAW